ncbi:hypothetical protein GCM10023323_39470 [Streptomyces thinghirensis]|uniref:Uncharacterized protein n=1 Tax=Streptomyces thinghirensis TaxID=551547 RepID=A0ABP9T4Y1_9ACTN
MDGPWLEAFAGQQVAFHRGTNTPGEAVAVGDKKVGVGAWDGNPAVN